MLSPIANDYDLHSAQRLLVNAAGQMMRKMRGIRHA
jgi:hypothetical protein